MKTRHGSELSRADLQELPLYDEEPQAGLNLSNNTNLFGANPAIARALAHARPEQFWNYPTIDSAPLRRAAAHAFGVREDMVITGNGSNEIIDLLFRAFVEPGERATYHPPTFSMIPVFMRANHAKPLPVALRDGFHLDPAALVAARAKVTFICRPNNPTGNAFARRDVQKVLDEAEGLVVIDEAYVEYAEGSSFVAELAGHPNLVVLRTLSKAHGLAGLRIGFGLAHPDVVKELLKVRGPFRLNTFSESVATIALSDFSYVKRVAEETKQERARLAQLLEREGFKVFPSESNFLLTKPPTDAKKLAEALARRGVHVRDFTGELAGYLRMTVGPPTVTARFLTTLREVLREVRA